MTDLTVLVAHPRPDSSLRAAAVQAADALATGSRLRADIGVIDLAGLGPELLAARPGHRLTEALAALGRSDVIVVATPLIHGTYAGLLKVFLDRLPELGLAHAVTVPVAGVPDLRHGHAIEEDLRVVCSDLGAWVVEPGLLLAEAELVGPAPVVRAWAEVASPALREALAVRT
jgi:FMN reductase